MLIDGIEISRLPEDKLAEVRGQKAGLCLPVLSAHPDTHRARKRPAASRTERLRERPRARPSICCAVWASANGCITIPIQLSGGEQQRVALARAFVLDPPIVFADEPTGNLDSENGAHVLDLLLGRNRASGATLVLVTHDAQISSRADRRIVLRDGAIVEDTMQRPA